MTPEQQSRRWVSVHLFGPGPIYGEWGDRVLLDCLVPFVHDCESSRWIDSWFYIRYNEHGPHLRARFFGDPRTLAEKLIPDFERALRARVPATSALGAGTASPVRNIDSSPVQRFSWIEYAPETDRYGGPIAISLAERHFHRSSQFAVTVLRDLPPRRRELRLGRALLATLVAIHSAFHDRAEAAEFARLFGLNYLRTIAPSDDVRAQWAAGFDQSVDRQMNTLAIYVEDAWNRMACGDPLTDALDALRDDFRDLCRNIAGLCLRGEVSSRGHTICEPNRAYRLLFPSLIHMTNNRLGIDTREEAFLARVINRTLSGQRAASPDVIPFT